jgi:hypothetical protein
VRFDDRLLTVLNQPASDRHDAAVRWRQLVDLVARAGPGSSGPVLDQALESIRSDAGKVDENVRAAAARAVAALPLPVGLLEYFASDRLSVSAPVLAAATLDAAQWRALLAKADEETRRFVETVHPEITAAEADLTPQLVEEAPARAEPAAPPRRSSSSLSEVVARIERRRRVREQQPSPGGATQGVAPALFRWECGPSGEISWVEGAPRGALIGRSIARTNGTDSDHLDAEVVRAFEMRAPFRDGQLTIGGEGLVSGKWKISGVPAFEPADGRFAGYRGIALRDAPAPEPAATSDVLADPDSLRELVHEIKTPLNAIIGFAEIIDGQLLGPADRRYRERAGDIVGQARVLLGTIDDLDFAAKIQSGRGAGGARVDLGELLDHAAGSLRELASARGVELEFARSDRVPAAAVEPELADRLIYRLGSAAIEAATAAERLRLSVDQGAGQCRVSISRPSALRGMTDAELFDPASRPDAAAFPLRLVRGLARIAGGDLVTSPAGIALVFPPA